jgi:hypothetical protein
MIHEIAGVKRSKYLKLSCATCGSLLRRMMKYFARFVKLVAYSCGFGWKSHELA